MHLDHFKCTQTDQKQHSQVDRVGLVMEVCRTGRIHFKGHFRLGNRKYCYPLTLSDHFSRYILCCESLENTRAEGVFSAMAQVFTEYGLPDAIRSDNGTPFASCGVLGLTKFGVWMLRHGVRLERIQPGHPEQNGRHERMHLTLKQDTTHPAADNFLQQQESFDDFRETFNTRRPHEALNMQTPAKLYQPSKRAYEPHLEQLKYPLHDLTLRVQKEGTIYMAEHSMRLYISQALAHQHLGLRQVEQSAWLVNFMDYELGYIDTDSRQFLPVNTAETLAQGPKRVKKV